MKLMFDRQKRASKTKEGSIELRITLGRVKKHATTGVRVFPREWRNGHIVNRLDAYELQRTLDMYVAHARKVINDLTERGEFDIDTIVSVINGKQREASGANVAKRLNLSWKLCVTLTMCVRVIMVHSSFPLKTVGCE